MWGSSAYGQWMTAIDLKKSSLGDGGPDPTDSSSPKTNLPFFQMKKLKVDTKTPHQHPYGTRSKTQTNAVFQTSDVNDDKVEYTHWRSLASIVYTLGVVQVKNSVIFHPHFLLHAKSFSCLVLFPN